MCFRWPHLPHAVKSPHRGRSEKRVREGSPDKSKRPFQFTQTLADTSATCQRRGGGQSDKCRFSRRAAGRAQGSDRGPPGALPLSLTCLAKSRPSSLRLFSFLAAINRSGATTSRKRCSMTAGSPFRAATRASCFALGAPEPWMTPTKRQGKRLPGLSTHRHPAHVGEHAALYVISPRRRQRLGELGSPSSTPSAA